MKIHFLYLFSFSIFCPCSFSQTNGNIMPLPDTLYFPFYDEVQMIEIDHLSYYEMLDMRYGTMDQMPYYNTSFANEYFFRDKTGKIVKSFNSSLEHDTLETQFREAPFVNQSSHYNYENLLDESLFLQHNYEPNQKREFYYSIFDHTYQDYFDRDTSNLKMGLIDTLGNILFRPEFDDLIQLEKGFFLASKNFQYGIINSKNTVIVPFEYFRPDNPNQSILFFNDHESVKVAFDIKTERVINIPPNRYQLFFQVPELFVTQYDGLMGVWDIFKGRQIIPNKYDYINIMTYYNEPNQLAIIVGKDKKYGLYNTEGKVLFPCEYDEIGRWNEVSGKLVLKVVKNGAVTTIKEKEK